MTYLKSEIIDCDPNTNCGPCTNLENQNEICYLECSREGQVWFVYFISEYLGSFYIYIQQLLSGKYNAMCNKSFMYCRFM